MNRFADVGISLFVAMLVCLFAVPRSASAWTTRHPVSIVEAEIYVNRLQTTVRLTCFAEDLELLQGAQYLAEKIRFLDVNGEPIAAKITGVVNPDLPKSGAEAGTLMQYTLGFEFELKYDI